MGDILEARRDETETRFEQLQERLITAEALARDKACVYATGSFGRGEASKYSDLDLFIVSRGSLDKPALSNLDEICLKAELIEATRTLAIPEFSGDGEYLAHYTKQELIERLGEPHDDAINTFTARLLLVLESRPLLGQAIYRETINDVIARYWRDFADHRNEFIPGFLANDILRLWRTFCVNYEARTTTEPEEKRAKRKVKNYKLKHSRLLTCYSALLYLLAVYQSKGSVHPQDVVEMTQLSPTSRLQWLLTQESCREAYDTIGRLMCQYRLFLDTTNCSESELVARFFDREARKKYSESENTFGDLMFTALCRVGKGNRFHRLLMV
jgi:nucleotidyltransferase-like protein